jgi:signal transduction histidine kinase/HAMP domain-containing protein
LAERFVKTMPDVAAAAMRRVRGITTTIRGKIVLAFCALAVITAILGWNAMESVVESRRMVVKSYERPLQAMGHARLAMADIIAMELTLVERQSSVDEERRRELDQHIQGLAGALQAELSRVEANALSPEAALAARATAALSAEWTAERQMVIAAGQDATVNVGLERLAARLNEAFAHLVEVTAEDGLHGRDSALNTIESYRWRGLATILVTLLVGAAVAILLTRRMVRPIAIASRAARRIAAGELDVAIAAAGGDELGELLAAMAVMRDNIRAMMAREIAARRSAQSRLVNAIESSAEGIIVIDEGARILIANTQVAAFFPELAGAFAPGAMLPAALETALARPTGEIELADGRWLRLSRSGNPDGGFVVIASDITAIKDRERVLQAAKEEAELASRSKTEFLANMSHELRTPLNAVIGFSEIMSSEMFGPLGQPKYKEYVDDIQCSGRHLLDVINDILDVAKMQSGKAELNRVPTQLGVILEESMRIMAEQAKIAGITLTHAIDPNIPEIEADAKRLRQLLLNLLSNAVKFTPPGGTITVTAGLCPEGITLVVSDTGIGMAAKDIPKALEPFSQIDNSITRKYGGTGLGLPLSKLFAELHGGRLMIASTPGSGTAVTVILPAPLSRQPPLAIAV